LEESWNQCWIRCSWGSGAQLCTESRDARAVSRVRRTISCKPLFTLILHRSRTALALLHKTFIDVLVRLQRDTFKWTSAGLVITASTAYLAFTNGLVYRMMAMNPWVVMGGGLVLSIGSMYGVMSTAPDSPAHYGCWAVFSAMQGLTLSPMALLNPAILGRAALYTAGAVGGISYVGATAKSDQYLWLVCIFLLPNSHEQSLTLMFE